MNELDCQTIFELLSQYLDQELPPATCAELERHIQECAPCVEFVNSLRQSVRLCRQFETTEQPPALSPSAKESLRNAYEQMLRSRDHQ